MYEHLFHVCTRRHEDKEQVVLNLFSHSRRVGCAVSRICFDCSLKIFFLVFSFLFVCLFFQVEALDYIIEKLKVVYFAKYGFTFPLSGYDLFLSWLTFSLNRH